MCYDTDAEDGGDIFFRNFGNSTLDVSMSQHDKMEYIIIFQCNVTLIYVTLLCILL